MQITKFEILEDGDVVKLVSENKVHVLKKNGEYHVYTLYFNEEASLIDFNVLVIKKGYGAFDVILDADLSDLKSEVSND